MAAPPMTPPLSTPFLDCQGVSWAWLEAESRRAQIWILTLILVPGGEKRCTRERGF